MRERMMGRVAGGAVAGIVMAGGLVATGAAAGAAPGVSYQVSGRVVAGGEPVYGHLEFYKEVDDGEGGTFFEDWDTVHSDGPGTTFSADLTDGTYKLWIADEGDEIYASEWYDDATSLETATEIVVQDGDVALGDIELELPPSIVGQVKDVAGAPVAGIQVEAYPAGVAEPSDEASGLTDRNGRFVLQPGTGDWLLRFSDDQGDYATEWYDDAWSSTTATPVTLGATTVDLGTVSISAGGSVGGRVTDPAGAPIRGVQVGLLDAEGDYVSGTVTNRAGDYTIGQVAPGSYRIGFYDPSGAFEEEYWNNVATLAESTAVVVGPDQVVTGRNAALTVRTTSTPTGVDVTGLVVDSAGKPVRGMFVVALTNNANLDLVDQVDQTITDRTGRFHLTNLDPASLADAGYNPSDTTFRIGVGDMVGSDELSYQQTWLGGARTYLRSPTVTVPAGGTATAPTTPVRQYAGVRGKLTSVYGALDEGSVTAFDVDGNEVAGASVGRGGRYAFTSLDPGQTYRFQFSGYDGTHDLIRSWWKVGSSLASAAPVATRAGEFVSGVDGVLTDRVTALVAPRVTGSPVVGGTLTATTGSWNLSAGSDWAFTWLRGSTVVGSGASYRPQAADAGSRLTVRVTNHYYDLTGTATAASGVVRQASRSSATASYAKRAKRVTLTVKVSVPGVASPPGTVSVREGAKTVAVGVRLVKGVATVVVKRPKKGTHTYAVSYSGAAAVLPSSTTARVRVK